MAATLAEAATVQPTAEPPLAEHDAPGEASGADDGEAPENPWTLEALEQDPLADPGLRLEIRFVGEVPEPIAVDLTGDAFCIGQHAPDGLQRQHVLVDEQGGLADVFVSLTEGVPDERYKAPKEPVVLDQRDCVYVPQVFGVMTRQPIEIRNSDPTLHNVHALARHNKTFNVAMPTFRRTSTQTFKKGEDAIRIRCDVHAWMTTYCFSMEHPYFGVSDASGAVRIDTDGLPDGPYGVRVWHRTLGEWHGELELADGRGAVRVTHGG